MKEIRVYMLKETKRRSMQFSVWLRMRSFKPMEAKASGNYSMRVSNGTKKLQLLIKCCSLVLPRNHIGFDIFLSFIFQFLISLSLLCFYLSFSSLQLWKALKAVYIYRRGMSSQIYMITCLLPTWLPQFFVFCFHNKMSKYILWRIIFCTQLLYCPFDHSTN